MPTKIAAGKARAENFNAAAFSSRFATICFLASNHNRKSVLLFIQHVACRIKIYTRCLLGSLALHFRQRKHCSYQIPLVIFCRFVPCP